MTERGSRLLTVLGTRPEIIKCSPLLPHFDEEFEHVLVHTGQHYDDTMDARFFRDLHLRAPDANLQVGSGTRAAQIARMLSGLEPLMREFGPDHVFVQGDTNSTLAGALAAAALNVPVVHLEAGCRSFNRAMPEELNRILVDHIAARCLAPDAIALKNLRAEGIQAERIALVGSTAIDACLRITELPGGEGVAESFGLQPGGFLLATIHRAENTVPERLTELVGALEDLARDWPVLFPVHPRTASVLRELGMLPDQPAAGGVIYCEPVGYPEMMRLLQQCRALLTDSGGLQEEAAVLGTPTFILRDETEWLAFVEAGRHRLVGAERRYVVAAVRSSLDGGEIEAAMRRPLGLERVGASERVLRILHAPDEIRPGANGDDDAPSEDLDGDLDVEPEDGDGEEGRDAWKRRRARSIPVAMPEERLGGFVDSLDFVDDGVEDNSCRR